jgi:hypothetical protein
MSEKAQALQSDRQQMKAMNWQTYIDVALSGWKLRLTFFDNFIYFALVLCIHIANHFHDALFLVRVHCA